jgi:hypothetical protein
MDKKPTAGRGRPPETAAQRLTLMLALNNVRELLTTQLGRANEPRHRRLVRPPCGSGQALHASALGGEGFQHWNRCDLLLVQVFPEDPGRPSWLPAPDDLVRGGDEVDPEVVDGLGQRLIDHL